MFLIKWDRSVYFIYNIYIYFKSSGEVDCGDVIVSCTLAPYLGFKSFYFIFSLTYQM